MRVRRLVLVVLLVMLVGSVLQADAANYSRNAAVAYADQWAHGRSPDYKSFGSDGDASCLDCTNFASQVLRAGGMPELRGTSDIWHWYHYKDWLGLWNVSATFAASDQMNVHVTQFPAKYQLLGWPTDLSAGDFFLMDLPGNPFNGPDHARVIVGQGTVEEGDCIGCWALLGSQHCTDRKRTLWNFNIPDSVPRWSWHIVW